MLWNHVAYVTAQLQLRREGWTEHVQSQRGTYMAYADISSLGTMKLIMCEHDMTCQREDWQRTLRTAHKHMHLSFPLTIRLWSSTFLCSGRKCLTASVSLMVWSRETPCTLTSFVLPDTFMKGLAGGEVNYLLIQIMNEISLEINGWSNKMCKVAFLLYLYKLLNLLVCFTSGQQHFKLNA